VWTGYYRGSLFLGVQLWRALGLYEVCYQDASRFASQVWGSAVITSNWITSLKITSNTAQIVVSIAIDSRSWRLNSQEDLRAEEAK